jgi:hypothetical protein
MTFSCRHLRRHSTKRLSHVAAGVVAAGVISNAGRRVALFVAGSMLMQIAAPPPTMAYVLNTIVADVRQPAAQSGGTACPVPTHFNAALAGGIPRQWSTSLGTSPVTVLTSDQSANGRTAEVAATIAESFAIWTGVDGSILTSASLGPLNQTPNATACAADGVNTICFNQSDAGFSTGVLAFARVITADAAGEEVAVGGATSTFAGQIMDADILLRPNDATVTFATHSALGASPMAYDLESVLAHEMGQMFGLGSSGVWRAMMFPYVTAQGTFLGSRPTTQSPDAPLADDDRAAIRALYHDPSDGVYIGSISGRILPANPLALAGEPANTSGIFGAQVVAVNVSTGAVAAAAISGWSCSDPGPAVFDGSYTIAGLAVGPQQSYEVYAEPLDGPVSPENVFAQTILCRNGVSDPGWPAQFACNTPPPITNFSARIRSGS